ncbi:hypothetical protein ACE1B4_08460 [Aeromonas veronii]|uniref:hypothetical protein n=1 Tax=Aeromonas veronii TaxID=654 RepID=UPI001115FE58|nr:hypothetical protein [Aeromonas veronii]TNI04357.1 hypothetical protein CF135_15770 [Aeromonas veronii]HDO1312617.1 hypothetical protein [Aeromonas veronii]
MNRYMIDDSYFENKFVVYFLRLLSKMVWFLVYRNTSVPKLNESNENELYIALSDVTGLDVVSESKALSQWIKIETEIKHKIMKVGPHDFLQWECIRETMGEENSLFLYSEYNYVRKSKYWGIVKDKITYPVVGEPLPFLGNIKFTGATIHHLFCLFKYLDSFSLDFDKLDYIFEFGGGYGNMCKILNSIGFKGKYYIFDLPTMNAIQRYYLYCHEIYNVEFINSHAEWYSILDVLPKKSNNMLIATWSISECPLKDRTITLEKINKFNNFIIGYQECFGEVNNIEFFDIIKEEQEDVQWRESDMPSLPRHRLLVGRREYE